MSATTPATPRRSRRAERGWVRSVGRRPQVRRGGALKRLLRALVVRLDEPEVLVHVARDLGENVRRVLVAELVGLVDGGAHLLAESRKRAGQRLDVVLSADDRQ